MRRTLPKGKGKPPVKKGTPVKPPQPKESKVVESLSKAEAVLEQIKAEEAEDAKRARDKLETKVTGAELKWLQYLPPHDVSDPAECARVDKYNNSVYLHNNAMLKPINELLKQLGRPEQKLNSPQKYLIVAQRKYEEMLFNPEFRILKGVEFLAKRNVFPVRDYQLTEAPKKADEVAKNEEIERKIEEVGDKLIDITQAVGSSHKNNCTCENKWDGTSERCVGEGIRLRWRTLKDHHFLRPRVVPEKW